MTSNLYEPFIMKTLDSIDPLVIPKGEGHQEALYNHPTPRRFVPLKPGFSVNAKGEMGFDPGKKAEVDAEQLKKVVKATRVYHDQVIFGPEGISLPQYEAEVEIKEENPWIEWKGGLAPPIPYKTRVDLKMETVDGATKSTAIDQVAGHFSWEHHFHEANIIAYRIVEAAK